MPGPAFGPGNGPDGGIFRSLRKFLEFYDHRPLRWPRARSQGPMQKGNCEGEDVAVLQSNAAFRVEGGAGFWPAPAPKLNSPAGHA
jgi:hypothetical protein